MNENLIEIYDVCSPFYHFGPWSAKRRNLQEDVFKADNYVSLKTSRIILRLIAKLTRLGRSFFSSPSILRPLTRSIFMFVFRFW